MYSVVVMILATIVPSLETGRRGGQSGRGRSSASPPPRADCPTAWSLSLSCLSADFAHSMKMLYISTSCHVYSANSSSPAAREQGGVRLFFRSWADRLTAVGTGVRRGRKGDRLAPERLALRGPYGSGGIGNWELE